MAAHENHENKIIEYVEPVLNFCLRRLSRRQDAEDLAGEIMLHILNGIKKYRIESLEQWVWRIAHNRYARFIELRNKRNEILSDNALSYVDDDYDFADEIMVREEYGRIFRYLHTLSSEYRNILVDYYIGQMSVKQITAHYLLTEATVKWRLNVSREKIKSRIGENEMDNTNLHSKL